MWKETSKRDLQKRPAKETCKRDINIKWIQRYEADAQRLIPTKTRIHMKIEPIRTTCVNMEKEVQGFEKRPATEAKI